MDALDASTPQPPNFRVGLIEAEYDGEIVTALDVVEYYAAYGHSAAIKLFHLVRDGNGVMPNPYHLRVRTPSRPRVPSGLSSADRVPWRHQFHYAAAL